MMKKLAITAALALGAIATAGFAPAQARPARGANPACHRLTPVQLDQQFAEFNASWASKSPDAVAALFDDDAVLLATVASVPRTDSAGIRDYFVKFLKGSPVGRIDTSTIKSGCNWALRMGTWTVIMTDPGTGAKTDVKARYTFLYQFEEGKWRIEHLHSSVLPANP